VLFFSYLFGQKEGKRTRGGERMAMSGDGFGFCSLWLFIWWPSVEICMGTVNPQEALHVASQLSFL